MSRILCITAFLACCGALTASMPVRADLAAAVLPSSRSTEIDNTLTVFSTVINTGSETATGCRIENLSGLPLTLAYQTTDPATNLPTGTANTPVDLLPGQSQSFVLSLTPTASIDSVQVPFSYSCTSGATAEVISGVNTLLFSASETPVVDVIALSATNENTGALLLNESAGAFSLATVNIGAADTVTVAADTGDTRLPVSLSVCQTNPDTGACIQAPAASVDLTMATGATPTFSVFSQASDAVANDPALNRIFVRFTDSNAVVRGATSVALANELTNALRFSRSILKVLSQVFSLTFASTQSSSNSSATPLPSGETPQVTLPIDQIVACETSGQIAVTGTSEGDQSGGSSSLTMDFQNCDGINGTLTMVNNIAIDGTAFSFDATQNGSYSASECEEITLTEVRINGEFDLSDPLEDIITKNPFTTSGTISGSCKGEHFNCSLSEIDVQDEAAFIDNCTG